MNLSDFVERYNSKEIAAPFLTFKSKWDEPTEKRTHIGVSELGKPAIITAVKKLVPNIEEVPPLQARLRMHYGNLMEQSVIQMLNAYGTVDLQQSEVMFEGILGHIDGVWEEKQVFDIKMMSGSYFKRFMQHPNDLRGYLTQLACYSSCLNLPSAFICVNTDNFELGLKEFDLGALDHYLVRAKKLAKIFQRIETWKDIELNRITPPPPVPEVHQKKETGKFLVPQTMKYTALKPACYELEIGINGRREEVEYVTRVRPVHEIYQMTEQILADRIPF